MRRHIAAVRPRDRAHEGESQAGTPRLAVSAGPEPVEYQVQLVFRDAAAAVGDDQPGRRGRLAPDNRQLYDIALDGVPVGDRASTGRRMTARKPGCTGAGSRRAVPP